MDVSVGDFRIRSKTAKSLRTATQNTSWYPKIHEQEPGHREGKVYNQSWPAMKWPLGAGEMQIPHGATTVRSVGLPLVLALVSVTFIIPLPILTSDHRAGVNK